MYRVSHGIGGECWRLVIGNARSELVGSWVVAVVDIVRHPGLRNPVCFCAFLGQLCIKHALLRWDRGGTHGRCELSMHILEESKMM